jgi:hypothetical protein
MDLLSSTICSILATRNSAFKKAYKKGESMKASQSISRTAHFIDIENLSESSILDQELVQEVRKEYFAMVKPGLDDIFVIGVSHFNLAAATFGWGAGVAQYVVQSGQDGADLALAEALCAPCVTGRFSKVCIGSGDGLLAGIGYSLLGQGVNVKFAARQECASKQIFFSGCECILLPSLTNREEFALVS